MENESTRILAEIIKKEELANQFFLQRFPSIEIITRLIDIARHAPIIIEPNLPAFTF